MDAINTTAEELNCCRFFEPETFELFKRVMEKHLKERNLSVGITDGNYTLNYGMANLGPQTSYDEALIKAYKLSLTLNN